MKKIYFHVGSPKTGTSLLQAILEDNRSLIEEADIDLILPEDIRGKEVLLNWLSYYRGKCEIDLDLISSFLNVYQNSKAILSEETFSHDFMPSLYGNGGIDRTDETLGIINSFQYDEIKVILTIRRQDSFLKSTYTHFVHRHGTHASFDDWIKNRVNIKNLSWKNVIEKLASNHPIEVIPFETIRTGEYINKFLSSLDIKDLILDNGIVRDRVENPSFSDKALSLARLTNKQIHKNQKRQTINDVFMKLFPVTSDYPKPELISPGLEEKLHELYADENKEIHDNYFSGKCSDFLF